MFKLSAIQSHKGPYSVFFEENAFERLNSTFSENTRFIVDRNVAKLYGDQLRNILNPHSSLIIEATEENKSLDKFQGYVEHLVECEIRRDHILTAIGGGIIQDITCFIAATLFRGVKWQFYPTTLLAQADSCIGSKSSINVGRVKNVMGTFTPPSKITISSIFLDTLDAKHVKSGVGEMLKAHAISGPEAFNFIAADYFNLFRDKAVMLNYIQRSLEIKKSFIEEDEFDRGVRNIFNYGHSFGHALEAATDFAMPHGIAVTFGMDMANYIAMRLGRTTEDHYQRMHSVLSLNYKGYGNYPLHLDIFYSAISKDKKNIGSQLTLIIPDHEGRVHKDLFNNDKNFRDICTNFLIHNFKEVI